MKRAPVSACEECRDLQTHRFATGADLVYAVQTAAGEMERGVLVREAEETRTVAEQEAVYSAMEAGATPAAIRYRFRCSVCGDRFTLSGNPETGEGEWIRNEEEPGK
jgi:hypothetical protein